MLKSKFLRDVRLVSYQKYGHTLNSHDLLKAIAITLMVLDHVGYYFMPHFTELRLIGRFSFPLFFFLIGYSNHYRFKWDVLLLFLAIVAQDISLHIPLLPVNILGNVIVVRLILAFLSRLPWSKENLTIVCVATILCFPLGALLVDFGVYGLIMALCGYFARTRPRQQFTMGFFMAAYISYCAIELFFFHFTFAFSLIFVVVLALVFAGLYRYRFENYTHLSDVNPVICGVMLLSRYSLYVYAIHLMVFKLINVAQYPELYTQFRWL